MATADRPLEYLWPTGAPGAVGDDELDRPSLTVFLPAPERATSGAVVVCPGGGYQGLAVGHEGEQIGEWLNELGVAAFMLRYRISPRYRHPAPLLDARRAVRTVRARAAEWGVDRTRIGMWGFSAGGHLTATAGTQFAAGDTESADPIERVSSRPDFLVLAYPVISFVEPCAHLGSRNNLLGSEATVAQATQMSAERNVTPETPSAFLFHTTEDAGVPPENSVLFYLALRRAGVSAEMHVYEHGPHGVGLAPDDPVLSSWGDRLADWLRGRGIAR